jgi:hypothetical protein
VKRNIDYPLRGFFLSLFLAAPVIAAEPGLEMQRPRPPKPPEWLFSYRYQFIDRTAQQNSAAPLTLKNSPLPPPPNRLDQHEHRLEIKRMVSPNFTLVGMVPFLSEEILSFRPRNQTLLSESTGLGDIKIGGSYKIYDRPQHQIHINAGISFPTSEIDRSKLPPSPPAKKSRLPDPFAAPSKQALHPYLPIQPYPRELASGTWDLKPGIAYVGVADRWSWGSQADMTLRFGDGRYGKNLGNEVELQGWGTYQLSNSWNTALRMRLENRNRPAPPTKSAPPAQSNRWMFELAPEINYQANVDRLSWGIQTLGIFRFGDKPEGAIGTQLELTGWTAYRLSDNVQTTVRLIGRTGNDLERDIPGGSDISNFGSTIDVGLGFDLFTGRHSPHRSRSMRSSRLGIEVSLPLLRNLSGTRPESGWELKLNAQTGF